MSSPRRVLGLAESERFQKAICPKSPGSGSDRGDPKIGPDCMTPSTTFGGSQDSTSSPNRSLHEVAIETGSEYTEHTTREARMTDVRTVDVEEREKSYGGGELSTVESVMSPSVPALSPAPVTQHGPPPLTPTVLKTTGGHLRFDVSGNESDEHMTPQLSHLHPAAPAGRSFDVPLSAQEINRLETGSNHLLGFARHTVPSFGGVSSSSHYSHSSGRNMMADTTSSLVASTPDYGRQNVRFFSLSRSRAQAFTRSQMPLPHGAPASPKSDAHDGTFESNFPQLSGDDSSESPAAFHPPTTSPVALFPLPPDSIWTPQHHSLPAPAVRRRRATGTSEAEDGGSDSDSPTTPQEAVSNSKPTQSVTPRNQQEPPPSVDSIRNFRRSLQGVTNSQPPTPQPHATTMLASGAAKSYPPSPEGVDAYQRPPRGGIGGSPPPRMSSSGAQQMLVAPSSPNVAPVAPTPARPELLALQRMAQDILDMGEPVPQYDIHSDSPFTDYIFAFGLKPAWKLALKHLPQMAGAMDEILKKQQQAQQHSAASVSLPNTSGHMGIGRSGLMHLAGESLPDPGAGVRKAPVSVDTAEFAQYEPHSGSTSAASSSHAFKEILSLTGVPVGVGGYGSAEVNIEDRDTVPRTDQRHHTVPTKIQDTSNAVNRIISEFEIHQSLAEEKEGVDDGHPGKNPDPRRSTRHMTCPSRGRLDDCDGPHAGTTIHWRDSEMHAGAVLDETARGAAQRSESYHPPALPRRPNNWQQATNESLGGGSNADSSSFDAEAKEEIRLHGMLGEDVEANYANVVRGYESKFSSGGGFEMNADGYSNHHFESGFLEAQELMDHPRPLGQSRMHPMFHGDNYAPYGTGAAGNSLLPLEFGAPGLRSASYQHHETQHEDKDAFLQYGRGLGSHQGGASFGPTHSAFTTSPGRMPAGHYMPSMEPGSDVASLGLSSHQRATSESYKGSSVNVHRAQMVSPISRLGGGKDLQSALAPPGVIGSALSPPRNHRPLYDAADGSSDCHSAVLGNGDETSGTIRRYNNDQDRMIYVSWIPKKARAFTTADKRKQELELKRRLREDLALGGLNKVLLFPPKGVHCKLIFDHRCSAAAFLQRYGGDNCSEATERWKIDLCGIYDIDMLDRFDKTVVKIEWSQK